MCGFLYMLMRLFSLFRLQAEGMHQEDTLCLHMCVVCAGTQSLYVIRVFDFIVLLLLLTKV